MSPGAGNTETAAGCGEAGRHRRDQIKFFTIAEVAERLGVATRTVRRWIDRSELVAHDFGRAVRIAESDLKAFLAGHRRI